MTSEEVKPRNPVQAEERRRKVSAFVSMLATGPRTRGEVELALGISRRTFYHLVREAREAGVSVATLASPGEGETRYVIYESV